MGSVDHVGSTFREKESQPPLNGLALEVTGSRGLEGEAMPLPYHSGTEGHLVNRVGQDSSSLQSSAETALDAIGGCVARLLCYGGTRAS